MPINLNKMCIKEENLLLYAGKLDQMEFVSIYQFSIDKIYIHLLYIIFYDSFFPYSIYRQLSFKLVCRYKDKHKNLYIYSFCAKRNILDIFHTFWNSNWVNL